MMTGLPPPAPCPPLSNHCVGAAFDDLFAVDVLRVNQVSQLEVRLELRPDATVAARAASLAAKETGCCSFFTFGLSITDGTVSMTISTEQAHQEVLAALGARAQAKVGSRS